MKLLLALLILASACAHALPISGTSCAPTAEAAVAHLLQGTMVIASAQGFRVDAVHHDKLRNRSWAVVANCTDPSRPHIAFVLPASLELQSAAASLESTPVIHAGDRVTVISHTGDSDMRLLGFAENSGAVQQTIRIRLGVSLDASAAALSLRARVLGAGLVEVSR